MATLALGFAKDKLIYFVKDELIKQLQEKLKQGDEGINTVFELLKQNIKSVTVTVPFDKDYNVLNTINEGICNIGQSDEVRKQLKDRLSNEKFINDLKEKLKEKIPEMTSDIDALPEKLKTKFENLIDELIVCPVAAAGGSKKKRRQRKTKKRIHKRSRGRKQHSRK
jgi:hypothetical protein